MTPDQIIEAALIGAIVVAILCLTAGAWIATRRGD